MKLSLDLARVALCMIAALLLLEFGLRASGERFQASFYMPERDRGYSLRPRAEGWNVGEQENYVRVNSRGMRDREHSLARPENTVRIAVLGDSETEALQVPLDQTYFSVLERELNSVFGKYGLRIEVLSFGVGGYGLGPQYLTLKEKIWNYNPQIVIVADPIDGLILRSSRRLYPGDSFGAPFFEVRGDRLQLDPQTVRQRTVFTGQSPRQAWTADLMNQSLLLSLLNSARAKAGNNIHQTRAAFQPRASAKPSFPSDYWQTFPFFGPVNSDLKDAWTTCEALLTAMHEETSRHHAEFWLFVLDVPAQVDPDAKERLGFQRRLGVDTLFRTDTLLCDFAARAGIPHQALAPDLARLAAERNIVLHGFPGMPRNSGHLNEAGHLAVGRLIANALRGGPTLLSKTPLR